MRTCDAIFYQLENVLDFINLQNVELELERFGLLAALDEEVKFGREYSGNIQAGQRSKVEIRISVESEFKQDEAILADRKSLKNAVGNLIRNAVNAIIHYNVGNEIKVSVSKPGDEYWCDIEDNGPGIKKMEFNLGKSVNEINFPKRPSKGRLDAPLSLGIGLENAARFAQMHGGDLYLVRTRESEGSHFPSNIQILGNGLGRSCRVWCGRGQAGQLEPCFAVD